MIHNEICNRNLTPEKKKFVDIFSTTAVPVLTPTILPSALPLEIRFLLFGVR